ncbi:unnamed protein product [Phytomonas sp. EM1]|nr:unnamed protein product [Phytomonas sp. EM1]|eukprot:CCW60272.1 unnamed protein product [Phytomonas sp. isolate EM1]
MGCVTCYLLIYAIVWIIKWLYTFFGGRRLRPQPVVADPDENNTEIPKEQPPLPDSTGLRSRSSKKDSDAVS